MDIQGPAVVGWEQGGRAHYLQTDPVTSMVELRVNASHAAFKLSCPVPLRIAKGAAQTQAWAYINVTCIESFRFTPQAAIPDDPAFANLGNTVIRLQLETLRPLMLFVPPFASDPLKPGKRASQTIVDQLRLLTSSTSLQLYIYTASNLSHSQVALYGLERPIAAQAT